MVSWIHDAYYLISAFSKVVKVDVTVNHIFTPASALTSTYKLSLSDLV